MYFYPLCKMEHMIIDESKILVDYTLEYERIIGAIENPAYRDIKFDVYIASAGADGSATKDDHLSVFFWIDYPEQTITITSGAYHDPEQTITITSGAYHDEPLPKEVVDVIVDRLNLKGYTIH